jgi:hypothetical protein
MTASVSARRVPAVIAGVLAMLASVAAMAAVVVSDIAETSVETELIADDLPAVTPVKMTKVEVKPELEDPFPDFDLPVMKETKRGKRVNFGSFEGY